MNKEDFYRAVVSGALRPGASEEEVLACMIVLHTCSLTLADAIAVSDAGPHRVLAALTRSHSAEVVTSVLSARGEGRGSAELWCSRFEERTPFEVVDEIVGPWKKRVEQAVEATKRTGLVWEVTPEE